MTLTALCQNLRNYFDVDGMGRSKIKSGTFNITGGALDLSDFVKLGQYFYIRGSVYNEGVHKYGDEDLKDEEFSGEIHAMWIPDDIISLLGEMNEWEKKYGDVVNSPYNSESFGGYSYSKAGAGDGAESGAVSGVESAFASRLNRWRKAI